MVSVKSLTLSSSHYVSSLSVEPRSSLTYSQSIRLNRLRRVSVTGCHWPGFAFLQTM